MSFARFIQGLLAGPLIPVSQTLIVSIFPPEKKTAAISFWSTVVIVAPILGPILGGWISYDIYWPWIFFINIPIGLFAVFIIHHYLKPFETPVQRLPTDWVGLILLAIGVSCLQFLLDKGQQFDWLRFSTYSLLRNPILFVFCLFDCLGTDPPPASLRIAPSQIPSYNLSLMFIATMYAIYFGGVVLVPLWLQEYMGYTPIWAGIAVAPLGIIPAIFSGLIGKLVTKIGQIIPIGISLIFFALSSFDGAIFNTDIDLFHIAFSRFLFGFGLLFFIVPLFSLSVRDIPSEKLPSSTGMFHFVRAMMGGVGTSVFTTLWIRRSAFHHSNLVADIHSSRNPVARFYSQLKEIGFTEEKSQTLINEMVDQQASVLGMNDCFFLMGWIFIGMIAILLIKRQKKTRVI